MKQEVKCKIPQDLTVIGITNGKDYVVIDKGMSETFGSKYYYEIVDDSGVLNVFDAMFFENFINDTFENKSENINHPAHYGGKDNIYEAIKIIEHYKLGFCLGNTLKYILRAGKKDPEKYIEDLEKAKWYLERKINTLKENKNDY